MFKEMLKEFLSVYGPSGREKDAAEVIAKHIKPYADKVYYDVMGNLIAYKKGVSGKKIMLSTHMDQIGLIVLDIDDKGFLRVSNVGGVSAGITVAREVVFQNGTRGVTYIETAKRTSKEAALNVMYIDIGASSKEEALKKVRIGDMAVYASCFVDMGERFASGALDNRLSCAAVAEALKTMLSPHDIYAVFTVQEEVGLRGAAPAAYSIEPDLNISMDVTLTGDTPGVDPMSVEIGRGPTIKVMDSSVIVPVHIRRFMEDVAKKAGIPVQNEVLRAGGTDTGAIQRTKGGIDSGCVSIPTRYIHTPVETADMRDVNNAVKFINALVSAENLPVR